MMVTNGDGVMSEPINVFVEVAVSIASEEENDGEDDVSEDKELKSIVEGDKDEDDEVTILDEILNSSFVCTNNVLVKEFWIIYVELGVMI